MVAIFIDQQRCDLESGFQLDERVFTFDADSFANLNVAQTERSITLRLPFTPNNDIIMGFARDPATATPFNSTLHTGRVEVDGVILLEGKATLESIDSKKGSGDYTIRISDCAGEWIESIASRSLSQAPIAIQTTLDYTNIEQSWHGEKVVRMLPVRYDDYSEPYDSTSLYAPQRVMTVGDYHPFISVVEMLRSIFEGVGYTLESRFLESDTARKLYFSGCYPSAGKSLTRLENSSGFKAGRMNSATASADTMGRVWMSPLVLTSSVGNFVQSTEGEDFYNNRAVLQIGDQGVEYRPSTEASVGFEIFLKYTTDFKMVSSQRLQGFDHLYVDTGCDIEIPLANPFVERRKSVVAGVQYKCFVFDHSEGATYSLIYRTNAGDTPITSIGQAQTSFTMPTLSGGECLLLDSNGDEYTGHWAIYDGYVESTGEVTVEVRLQTPPEVLSPSKAKSFAKMYLHGAEQGQSMTLGAECTLRPLFSASPAAGTTLTAENILSHDATQLEFVKAVMQLFNLRIASCHSTKRVYIEPFDNFYCGALRDMSIYANHDYPIQASDLASEVRQRRTLCYRAEGDGAVARYNAQHDEHFGSWEMNIQSHVATVGHERNANPLFCPTISAKGIYASAPSAYIMQVGDRDADSVGEISMRVVQYEGMRALPDGERWGAPSFGGEYPYAAFHSSEEFTLCFEDRDGAQGLHRYYDREWWIQALRHSLTLRLNLPAHMLATLTEPMLWGGARDTYCLNITGQRALYYLRRIEGYDVATQSAQCQFVRLAQD